MGEQQLVNGFRAQLEGLHVDAGLEKHQTNPVQHGDIALTEMQAHGRWRAATAEVTAVQRARREALTQCLRAARAEAEERGRVATAASELASLRRTQALVEAKLR